MRFDCIITHFLGVCAAMLKYNSVQEAVEPVFAISKYLGCAPMTNKYDRSISFVIYSSLLMIFLCVLISYYLIFHLVMERRFGSKLEFYSTACLCVLAIFIVIVYISKSLNCISLKKVVKTCSLVDSLLKGIGKSVPYKMFSFWASVLFRMIAYALVILSDILSERYVLMHYSIVAAMLIINTVEFQFEIMIFAVTSRFSALNDGLKNMKRSQHDIADKLQMTVALTKANYRLYYSTQELNEFYSFQIFLYIFVTFFNLVFGWYDIIESLMLFFRNQEAILGTIWITIAPHVTLSTIMLFSIVERCESVTRTVSLLISQPIIFMLRSNQNIEIYSQESILQIKSIQKTVLKSCHLL